MSGIFGKLKVLDAYPKVNEDFFQKTLSGGIITVASSVVMVLLFLSEFSIYLRPQKLHELTVDVSRGEQISIYVDITFPHMPCSWLSLDTMDISGDVHADLDDHEVYKQRLTANGQPVNDLEKHDVHSTKKTLVPFQENAVNVTPGKLCLTCYGAEDQPGECCNTCDEVRAAYRRKGWAFSDTDHIEQCKHDSYFESIQEQKGEGCKMWGTIKVNKVAGNFHFAPGRSYSLQGMHAHDISPFGSAPLDFEHSINGVTFGDEYPGMHNPLDGIHASNKGAAGTYQYFLKVVPTVYSRTNNKTINTNQFSVTENFRESKPGGNRNMPGVFFFYELSPIKVKITETKSSFLHFVTNVCAIVGGVFTISGIVDAFVYQGEKIIRKKMEMGKLY